MSDATSRRGPLNRVLPALLVTLLVGALCVLGAPPATAATSSAITSRPGGATTSNTAVAAGPNTAVAAGPTVQFVSMSPKVPGATAKDRTIRFGVQVTAGSSPLTGAELELERGDPLIDETQLNAAITTPPSTDDVDIPAYPITATIAPGQSRTLVLSTTVDLETLDGTQGLCLSCKPGVYPVDVSLVDAATGTELTRAHTYVPYFDSAPRPVDVSWIWPLLDRPHRSVSRTIFDDDDLATSVAPNGRLWRALRVAELVGGSVRLTLVVDPDLIDSLMVMSKGYQVRGPNDVLHPGTGATAAAAWLARLARVARTDDVVRTPYADPDVDTLARNNVAWTNTLDAQVDSALTATLGIEPGAQFSWPVGARLSSQGLDSVIANGAAAVVLSDTSFPSADKDADTPDALAPLPSGSGSATAVVLSSTLQSTAGLVTTAGRTAPQNFSDDQLLLAQLAIRAVPDQTHSHYVALAPARYVDADPAVTAAAMLSITSSGFAADESVSDALDSVTAVDHGPVTSSTAGLGGLPGPVLSLLADARSRVDAFRECLSNNDASTLLSAYPAALSRGESAFWRDHPSAGQALAGRIRDSIATITGRVHITSPNNASYTLASSDAPLFITVENSLTVNVRVALRVEPAPGVFGLVVRPIPAQLIPPGIHQFKMSTHVERTGRFRMLITLISPAGKPFGASTDIRVKSTAFGRVGLWITGIAFGILILALAIRTVRRIRHRLPRPPRDALATATGAIS